LYLPGEYIVRLPVKNKPKQANYQYYTVSLGFDGDFCQGKRVLESLSFGVLRKNQRENSFAAISE